MELKINGILVSKYNEVSINLKFDCIADTFAIRVYFDPADQRLKPLFKPGSYLPCTISHGGVLVLTGTILRYDFFSAGVPPRSMVRISGYSVTGILQDCVPVNRYITQTANLATLNDNALSKIPLNIKSPYQLTGVTLEYLTTQLCEGYGLQVKVDPELANDDIFNQPYPQITLDFDASVFDNLDDLCKQKNVILSHDAQGNVLLTRQKASMILTTPTTLARVATTSFSDDIEGAPDSTVSSPAGKANRHILWDFSNGGYTSMQLAFDGQSMHSAVQVVAPTDSTATTDPSNGVQENPYVLINRYGRQKQTKSSSDDGTDTPETARSFVNDELKNLTLTVDMEGWTLGGNVVTPNQLIQAQSDDLYLFTKSKWFVQEVYLYSDENQDTATLTCIRPECVNEDPIVNIFE